MANEVYSFSKTTAEKLARIANTPADPIVNGSAGIPSLKMGYEYTVRTVNEYMDSNYFWFYEWQFCRLKTDGTYEQIPGTPTTVTQKANADFIPLIANNGCRIKNHDTLCPAHTAVLQKFKGKLCMVVHQTLCLPTPYIRNASGGSYGITAMPNMVLTIDPQTNRLTWGEVGFVGDTGTITQTTPQATSLF